MPWGDVENSGEPFGKAYNATTLRQDRATIIGEFAEAPDDYRQRVGRSLGV